MKREAGNSSIETVYALVQEALAGGDTGAKQLAETIEPILKSWLETQAAINQPAGFVRRLANEKSGTNANIELPDPMKDKGKYELWENRPDPTEKPTAFLERVWSEHLITNQNRKGTVLTQLSLRGQQFTEKNPNPKQGLDPKLFFALRYELGKELKSYIPSKPKVVQQEVKGLTEQEVRNIRRLHTMIQKHR